MSSRLSLVALIVGIHFCVLDGVVGWEIVFLFKLFCHSYSLLSDLNLMCFMLGV